MSARRDIRLLLADVDGTLVTDDKVLTEAAKDMVRDLRAAGIAFAITSSRPPRGMRRGRSLRKRPLTWKMGFARGELCNYARLAAAAAWIHPVTASTAQALSTKAPWLR